LTKSFSIWQNVTYPETITLCKMPDPRTLVMGGGTILKVGGHKCTSKTMENFCGLDWKLWRH